MDVEHMEAFEEEQEDNIAQGRNKKVDKNRTRYGRADPLNRITGHTHIPLEEALAWMSIIDGCSPAFKAEIYSWFSDGMVDVGLVQNSCYVACLPCIWDRYVAFFDFLHEQSENDGMRKISAEYVSEQWIKEKLDLLLWQNQ